jgi:prepilin-type N-terminal cleavage/methylation domain-containing protein
MRPGTRRRGFSLLEVVVALLIIAILAAVVATTVAGRVRTGASAAFAQTFSALSDAILEFRADVRRYPTHLNYLSAAPPSTEKDLCSQGVPSSYRSNWRGPYVKSAITTSGLVVSSATIRDSLELDPAGPYTVSTTGALVMVASNVDSTVANALELRYDGNSNFSSGVIRYTVTSSGQGTLKFALPVRGC